MLKHRTKKVFVLLVCLLIISMLGACNAGPTTTSTPPTTAPTSSTEATTTVPENNDPGKFTPPIEITVARTINANYKFNEGETYDNNVWNQGYLDELGIKLNYRWYIDASQYDQKIALDIAANDLPDMFFITGGNAKDVSLLSENNAIADLSGVYSEHASDALKSVIEFDDLSYQMMHRSGKLVSLGQPGNIYEGINVIWIRYDWLQNLNLQPPKNMQDLLSISKAFTENDPDKNGKNDTIGIAVFKDLYPTGFADLTGFFNGFHAYPKNWITDSSGKLVYGSIQPEMKDALVALQGLYENGGIDQEFGVQDGGKASEATTSGRVGIEFGAWWNPGWPLNASKEKDLNADWRPYSLVSNDSKPAKGSTGSGISNYFCVNSKFEHPEALVMMANFCLEKGWGASADISKYFLGDDGREISNLAFIYLAPVDKNIQVSQIVSAAVAKKDGTGLVGEAKSSFESAMKWVNEKNPGNWVHYICFGAGEMSAMSVIQGYQKNNGAMINKFYGAPTATMIDKWSTLQKMEIETITRIIMGKPLSEFDQFVTDWQSLGGADITTEVNDWLSASK